MVKKVALLQVFKVKQSKHLRNEEITRLVKASISRPALVDTALKCDDALPRKFGDPVKDHRIAVNPYQPRYPDDYIETICTSSAMKPFAWIIHLISFIMDESK